MKKERLNEIYGVLCLLGGLFILVGILFYDPADHPFYALHPNQPVQNPAGIIGAFVAHYLVLTLGLSAYSVPFLLLFWSSCFFLQKVPNKRLVEFSGILIAVASLAGILALFSPTAGKVRAGGFLGYFLAAVLERYFGFVGGMIISICCFFLAVLLFTDFLLYPFFQKIWDGMSERIQAWFNQRSAGQKIRPPKTLRDLKKRIQPEEKSKLPEIPLRLKQYIPTFGGERRNEKKEQAPASRESKSSAPEKVEKTKGKPEPHAPGELKGEKPANLAPPIVRAKAGTYEFPPLDLLTLPPQHLVQVNDDYQRNSQILEETLADFGLEVKVVEVEQGPVVTRYEILPAPGVKVTRILALSDDLALALKAPSIRFIAPIPGKSAIGIEIPNSVVMKVFLRELLEVKEFRGKDHTLPLVLGKDTSGQPMVSNLCDMPHLLIAGTTGSGKTVCINALIGGLVYSKRPDELKFVMVDPKMVELAVYNKLPHMLTPVVTDVRKAAATLNWVVLEMERRYRFFAQCGTRNIQAFNGRNFTPKPAETEGEEAIPEKLPYIVVVIDELADLMLVAQDKVEGAITRLAQLSRAVGIHLLLATQRPSVDVITGVIKANFPARISFKVASKIDSRTVLDMNGADKLIGKGDMLFLEPGREKPLRGQAPYVSDDEINAVVDFLAAQSGPEYQEEVIAAQEGRGGSWTQDQDRDELYEEAVRIIFEAKQASTSVLQRRLRLGYGRAARIIDMMEQDGIVGPNQGTKPRDIMVEGLDEALKRVKPV